MRRDDLYLNDIIEAVRRRLLADLLAAVAEDVWQASQGLPLPTTDLGWVDAKHLRDLGCGSVCLDRLDGDFGLQTGRVTLARSGH